MRTYDILGVRAALKALAPLGEADKARQGSHDRRPTVPLMANY